MVLEWALPWNSRRYLLRLLDTSHTCWCLTPTAAAVHLWLHPRCSPQAFSPPQSCHSSLACTCRLWHSTRPQLHYGSEAQTRSGSKKCYNLHECVSPAVTTMSSRLGTTPSKLSRTSLKRMGGGPTTTYTSSLASTRVLGAPGLAAAAIVGLHPPITSAHHVSGITSTSSRHSVSSPAVLSCFQQQATTHTSTPAAAHGAPLVLVPSPNLSPVRLTMTSSCTAHRHTQTLVGRMDWVLHSDPSLKSSLLDELRIELTHIFHQSPALPRIVQKALLHELLEQLGPLQHFSLDDVHLTAAVHVLDVLCEFQHPAAVPLLTTVLEAVRAAGWPVLRGESTAVLAQLSWNATELCVLRPSPPAETVALYHTLLPRLYTACVEQLQDITPTQSIQLLACMGASKRFGNRKLLYTLVHQAEQGLEALPPPPEEPSVSGTSGPAEEYDDPFLSSLGVTPIQLGHAIAAAAHLDKHNFPGFIMTAASFLTASSHVLPLPELGALVQDCARLGLRPKPLLDSIADRLTQRMLEWDDSLLQDEATHAMPGEVVHLTTTLQLVDVSPSASPPSSVASEPESVGGSGGRGVPGSLQQERSIMFPKRLTHELMNADSAAALSHLLSRHQADVTPIHTVAAITRAANLLTQLNEQDDPAGVSDTHLTPRKLHGIAGEPREQQAGTHEENAPNTVAGAPEVSQLYGLMQELCLPLSDQLSQHSAKGLAVLIWQWGRANFRPSEDLLAAIISRVVQDAGADLQGLTTQEVIMLVTGLASLRRVLDSKVWEFLVLVVVLRAEEFTIFQRVHLYWSVARVASSVGLAHKHRNMLRNELLSNIADQMQLLDRAEMMQLLNAMMELRHKVPSVLEGLSAKLEPLVAELSAQEICHVAYCFARLGAYSPPLSHKLQQTASQRLQLMNPADVGKLCWAVGKPLQMEVQDLVSRLQQRTLQLLPLMTPQPLAEVLALSARTNSHHYELFKNAAKQLVRQILASPTNSGSSPSP